MIIFWLLDSFVDDSLFRYGRNRICLLSGNFGKLYLVVVPTTIMVVFNAGCLIFSIIQLSRAWDQRLDKKSFFDYVKFMGKMTVFQSLQWVFGIVYYFASSPIAGMVFEVLVAYEGNFITVFFLVAKWQTIKERFKSWKDESKNFEETNGQCTEEERS